MLRAVSKVVRNGQLTIPSKIRKVLHIKDNDLIRFDVTDNKIVITPVSIVNKDQVYFFTEKWQKVIKKAEGAIKKGKYSVYHSGKELKKDVEG